MRLQVVAAGLFAVATIAALAATPFSSGWAIGDFTCDLGASPDWAATVLNVRHLVSFGVLALLGFLAFRDQPAWIPLLLLLLVTGAVEIEEGLFASGHCRARDMIPDILAIGVGWVAATAVRMVLQRYANRTRA